VGLPLGNGDNLYVPGARQISVKLAMLNIITMGRINLRSDDE
jgi:hypothetical protein